MCTCVYFGKGCLLLVLHSGVLGCSVCVHKHGTFSRVVLSNIVITGKKKENKL